MQHLWEQFERQAAWFDENVEKPEPDKIVLSDKTHCGQPMEQYVGERFVDWTHRCRKCGAMYGCA